MNYHDGLGAAGDLGSQQVRVEIPGIRLTIDHYGDAPRAHNRCRAGNDGEARQDHLVPTADLQSRDRNFNGNAPIAHSHAMCTAHQLPEPRFWLFDKWTFRGDPARLDAFREILLLITIENWTIDRYHDRLIEVEFLRHHCDK